MMDAREITAIMVYTPKMIYASVLMTSVFFIAIGINTWFYGAETVIQLPHLSALSFLISGVMGVLYSVQIIKQSWIVNSMVNFTLVFRISSLIYHMTVIEYSSPNLTAVFMWTMMWFSFLLMAKFIKSIDTHYNKLSTNEELLSKIQKELQIPDEGR
jgi:hypothetical protein